MLLHQSRDFADLLAVVAREQAVNPGLVEKDYWIMHVLWGLQQPRLRPENPAVARGHPRAHQHGECCTEFARGGCLNSMTAV